MSSNSQRKELRNPPGPSTCKIETRKSFKNFNLRPTSSNPARPGVSNRKDPPSATNQRHQSWQQRPSNVVLRSNIYDSKTTTALGYSSNTIRKLSSTDHKTLQYARKPFFNNPNTYVRKSRTGIENRQPWDRDESSVERRNSICNRKSASTNQRSYTKTPGDLNKSLLRTRRTSVPNRKASASNKITSCSDQKPPLSEFDVVQKGGTCEENAASTSVKSPSFESDFDKKVRIFCTKGKNISSTDRKLSTSEFRGTKGGSTVEISVFSTNHKSSTLGSGINIRGRTISSTDQTDPDFSTDNRRPIFPRRATSAEIKLQGTLKNVSFENDKDSMKRNLLLPINSQSSEKRTEITQGLQIFGNSSDKIRNTESKFPWLGKELSTSKAISTCDRNTSTTNLNSTFEFVRSFANFAKLRNINRETNTIPEKSTTSNRNTNTSVQTPSQDNFPPVEGAYCFVKGKPLNTTQLPTQQRTPAVGQKKAIIENKYSSNNQPSSNKKTIDTIYKSRTCVRKPARVDKKPHKGDRKPSSSDQEPNPERKTLTDRKPLEARRLRKTFARDTSTARGRSLVIQYATVHALSKLASKSTPAQKNTKGKYTAKGATGQQSAIRKEGKQTKNSRGTFQRNFSKGRISVTTKKVKRQPLRKKLRRKRINSMKVVKKTLITPPICPSEALARVAKATRKAEMAAAVATKAAEAAAAAGAAAMAVCDATGIEKFGPRSCIHGASRSLHSRPDWLVEIPRGMDEGYYKYQ